MTLLLWLVRLLILVIIIRFVMALVSRAMSTARSQPNARQPKRAPERIGGTLVQDPQCGTYVPQERALAVTAGGSTQYFCSTKCRDEWVRRG